MQGSTIEESNLSLNYHATATTNGHGHGHPDHRLFGIALFLVAESSIFLGLFVAFWFYRAVLPVWPPAGTPELELTLPAINTFILVSSSFVMHMGQKAIKKDSNSGLQLWFGLTALMGIAFLIGQGYEYTHAGFGLKTNLFTSAFYVLTGFHGLHVTFGLCLILGVLWRSLRKDHYSSKSHFGVEAAELYWHFVDVVWIVLFLLVYILK